jgi:uncharacterized protein DUF4424
MEIAMLRPLALAIGICAIAGSAAQGNDSSAELATGGLVLKKNTDIEMQSENLYISPKQIRVKYEFYNPSSKDMRTVVAFPMPDITVTGFHDIAVPTDDAQNIVGFSTKIDGKSAPVRVEQKAFADGKELTAVLTRLGVPLAPHLPTTLAALDRLAPEALGELKRLNLVEVEEFDAGKGMEKHASPRWTLKTTYYWDQIFPAKSETTIEHQYIPSVGSSIQQHSPALRSDAMNRRQVAKTKLTLARSEANIASMRPSSLRSKRGARRQRGTTPHFQKSASHIY